MKKRRWICLALTAALTFGMLAGCGQMKDLSDGGEKKELQKVTLNEVAAFHILCANVCGNRRGLF